MQVQLVRDFAIKYRRGANKEILHKLVEAVLQKIIIVFFAQTCRENVLHFNGGAAGCRIKKPTRRPRKGSLDDMEPMITSTPLHHVKNSVSSIVKDTLAAVSYILVCNL